MNESLRSDPWMTQMLGKPSYQWTGEPMDSDPDALAVEDGFISAKLRTDDFHHLSFFQQAGFSVVDVNIQFRCRDMAPVRDDSEVTVRPAEPRDENGVRKIANSSFKYDRFHADPRIPTSTANRIKEEWVGNFFQGKRGSHMLVAEREGTVAGFLLLISGKETLTIDLVAVAAEHQGKGLSSLMISTARHMFTGGDKREILVGTQISNLPSIGLYTKLGFRLHEAYYVLHRHQS